MGLRPVFTAPPDPRTCRSCGQNAPLVYRGVLAYCTACGQMRAPLANAGVNFAGQPSQIGGSVAHVLGWLILGVGLLVALVVGVLFQAIFPAGFVGWLFGSLLAVISVALGLALVFGGRGLKKTGADTARSTKHQAIFALAAHRGGVLSALDVSTASGIPVTEADALMTALAKEESDRAKLEVDDNGAIYYVFPEFDARPWSAKSSDAVMRARVADEVGEGAEADADAEPEPARVQRTRSP